MDDKVFTIPTRKTPVITFAERATLASGGPGMGACDIWTLGVCARDLPILQHTEMQNY